jgi:TolA-binding protein
MTVVRKVAGVVLALTAWMASGCFWTTTKSEGRALRRDVMALEQRVTTKEDNLDSQVATLKRVVDEATRLLARNSANLGADFHAVQTDMRQMRGLLSSLQTAVEDLRGQHAARLDAIEKRLVAMEQKPSAPSGPAELWRLAKDAWEVGRYEEARELYERLVAQYPGDDRADDAQYFRGEAYFAQRSWMSAIREYRRVVDKHPDSPLADDALFRAAEAATQLKSCAEARTYLGLLKERYRGSNLLKKAESMDKDLRARAKTKGRCS